MKSKNTFTLLIALFAAASAFAQGVETDDMYFNAKDRAKLNAQQATEQAAYASAKKMQQTEQADDAAINPTDSYSARNVNPEYVARANAQTAKADDQDYYVNNYKYQTASNLNSWNSNFNNWYGNPWYNANYYSPSVYGWNSPYYGSFYDPWGGPWSNPYYQSGWSSSFSYYWGSSYNYGWGGCPYASVGVGYGWGSPYYGNGFGNSWGPAYGYNSGWYGYPSTVVIVGEGNHVTYGKRPTRGTAVASVPAARTTPTRTRVSNDSYYAPNTTGRSSYSGGRVPSTTSTSTRQEDYYNRNYRTSQQYSYPAQDNNADWGNNSRSSYSNYGNQSGSYNRSNTSNNSYSPPTRSTSGNSSFSGGGGGGGRGRTRD